MGSNGKAALLKPCMLARWRPCSTTSGELSRRCCVSKKENAERVANYLQTMGIIWRVLSRPKAMIMGQIACLDANGIALRGPAAWWPTSGTGWTHGAVHAVWLR